MNNIKHTAGEWRVNRTGQDNIVDITARRPNERQDICRIEGKTEAEAIANAKLIATAPELLEVLIKMNDYFLHDKEVSDEELKEIIETAIRTVKKATE